MSRTRVLLVDDEGELVFTLAERLELRGYEVDAVTNGAKALELIGSKTFDVAVVDVKMPGMSGQALVEAMREEHPNLPVILLTGHGSPEEEEQELRRGVCAYLFKPVQLEELIQTMGDCIREKPNG